MKKLLFLFSMVLLASCARNIQAPEPQAGVFPSPPEAKESVLLLPLSIRVAEVQNFVNASLPLGRIHAESGREGNTTRWNYEIRRDQPISFTAAGNELIFKIPLRVNAGGSYTACVGFWRHGRCCSTPNPFGNGCATPGVTTTEHGNTTVNVEVLLKTSLALKSDYSIAVNTNLDASIVGSPHLQIDLIGNLIRINIPIKDRVEPPLRTHIARMKPELDRKIAEHLAAFDIRSQLATYWEQLKQSVPLDQYWLNITPAAVYFENLQSDGERLFMTVGAGAAFRLSDQQLPPSTNSLPDLTFTSNKPGMFSIHLPVDASFQQLAQLVKSQVVDKEYKQGKLKVTIKDVALEGVQLNDSTAAILAKVDFKGSAGFFRRRIKGNLYFTAVPAYDKEKQQLYMASFALTPGTNSMLINKGVPWLIDRFYYEELKSKMRYDFSQELNNYTTLLQNQLDTVNIDKLVVHGKLEKLSFEGFHIASDALHLLILSSGSLEIEPIVLPLGPAASGRR